MQYATPKPITSWAEEDRPREKLMAKGVSSLTEAELMAILIGSGTRELSAVDLSRHIIEHFGGLRNLARCSVAELTQIKGIGEAKAISIMAAFELAKRKQLVESKEIVITSPESVAAYLTPRMEDLPHEVFYVLFLNRKNKIIGEKQISSGGVNNAVVDTRILFKEAVNLLANGLVISHNHPSGSLEPSKADRDLTEKIKQGARLFDMALLDHLIITNWGFYSFADNGLL